MCIRDSYTRGRLCSRPWPLQRERGSAGGIPALRRCGHTANLATNCIHDARPGPQAAPERRRSAAALQLRIS
eukprot:367925-Heterocapsa_arctica.AAC.1